MFIYQIISEYEDENQKLHEQQEYWSSMEANLSAIAVVAQKECDYLNQELKSVTKVLTVCQEVGIDKIISAIQHLDRQIPKDE